MNGFVADDVWQRQMRAEFLLPYYQKTYRSFVLLDRGRFARHQQPRGMDTTIAWREEDMPFTIEEKIVRYPGREYTALCLETESCTKPGYIARGWMWHSEADILLYCMETASGDLDCRAIDFPRLHEWFWPREKEFPLHVMADTINRTASRIVPVERIEQFIKSRFTLTRHDMQQAAE